MSVKLRQRIIRQKLGLNKKIRFLIIISTLELIVNLKRVLKMNSEQEIQPHSDGDSSLRQLLGNPKITFVLGIYLYK